MPVENLHRILPEQGKHDVFPVSVEHIAPPWWCGKHRQIIRHTVLAVKILFSGRIWWKLGRKENAVRPHFNDPLHQSAGALRNRPKSHLDFFSKSLCHMSHQVGTEFICRRQRTEHGKNHRHCASCLIQKKPQVFLLSCQSARIHRYRFQIKPILWSVDRCRNDFCHAAPGDFRVVRHGTEIFNAVHAVVHRL